MKKRRSPQQNLPRLLLGSRQIALFALSLAAVCGQARAQDLGGSVKSLVGPPEQVTFAAGMKYSGTYMLSLLVPTREWEYAQSDIAINRSGSPSVSADYLRVLTRMNAWLDIYAGAGAKIFDSRTEFVDAPPEPGKPLVAIRLPLGTHFNFRPINGQVSLEVVPSFALGAKDAFFAEPSFTLRLLI